MKVFKFKPALIAALAAAGFTVTAAHAETTTPNGPYAGASIGVPSYQDDVNGFSGHGDGASGKIFGGYQITPNFALEGGFAELGKTEQANGDVRSHAVFLDAVGIAPIAGGFSVLGRIGAADLKADTPAGDDRGAALKLGAGVQYAFTQNMAVRGEWERYHADVFNDKPDIDQYTVGLRVGF